MFGPATSKNAVGIAAPPPHVLLAYVLFLAAVGTVYHFVANGAFSSILTMAVMFQCLAFALLSIQVLCTESVAGISARALALDALALCCRLSSTTWLNGYLPVDDSGDWVFQLVDICSLVMALWMLSQVLVVRHSTYQAEQDKLPVYMLVIGAFVLALLFHADMNSYPLFDMLWMAGLFIGTVAVLPQLWMIMRTGGRVHALTSHYIAAMAVSRMLSGIFMWHARYDITCTPWINKFNHASWIILAAHLLHLVLLGDFAFVYVRAVVAHGFNCRLLLDDSLV
jgi:hypothetical protein